MDDVTQYFSFAEVVRTGSFTAAAASLGVSKATISKQVSQLEAALGVRLLHRTTRKLAPTAEGAALYSTLVARRLGTVQRVICATPEYLARHGIPRTPQDLRRHRCLHYVYLASGDTWPLSGPDGEVQIAIAGPLRANSSLALEAAVLAHVGVAQFPAFVVGDELRDARLVRVLEDHAPVEVPMWAVHASGRTVAPKIDAWIDFLLRRVAPALA